MNRLPHLFCGIFPQIPTFLKQWRTIGHLPSSVDEDLGVKEKEIWFQMTGQKRALIDIGMECLQEKVLSVPPTLIFSPNTPLLSPSISPNTFSGNPGVSWDKPRPPSTKKVPNRNGLGTFRDLTGLIQNGEGGSRLRPKWDGMTQHGKGFPNRVGNTTTNITTQRMSLMWSRPNHEGKCPGRFQITDDFRQAQKKAEHR